MKSDLGELRRLAAVQGGFLLTLQAIGCGLARRDVARTLRCGGWVRLHQGAWAEPGRVVDLPLRLRAFQLQHPDWIASHSSAAEAHGIAMMRQCSVEFTPFMPVRRRRADAVLHRGQLAEAEVTVVAGVRVTAAVRTVCDLLRTLPRDEAVIAADSAIAGRLVNHAQVESALRARPRRPGSVEARAFLALTDPLCGSPAESQARLVMHDAGLRPESQVEVTGANGRTRRLDFLFREEGLAVEIEGFAWHGSRSSHQRDIARFNELGNCPEVRQFLRFSRDDVFYRPRLMIRTIKAALAGLRAG